MSPTHVLIAVGLSVAAVAGCGDDTATSSGSGATSAPSASASRTDTPSSPPTTTSPSATPTSAPTTQSTKPTAQPTTAATSEPSTPKYGRLAGDWTNAKIGWTLHLKANGTYKEDFEGQQNISGGTYRLKGRRVTLFGDGGKSVGRYDGKTLTFDAYVLTRRT